jgi:predicted dehydrogenase
MTVRVGFLGAGLIAHFHALGLFESDEDVAFAGVYDPDGDRADEFATGWGATRCTTEDEVLDGCDAVIICTWTSEHARLVDLVCERKLPLLCEKPLAFDARAATAMADAVDAAGIINQVGLLMRYSPPFAYLGHLVRDPAAGRVMSVVFRDDQYIPVQGMYASTWRGDKARAGAGTLLEHSIHDLDILEQVVGPLRSVSARSANFHGFDGIEDSVATSFDLASGGVGVHATIWHDVMERPSTRRIEIFCERRHLVLEDDEEGPITWVTTGEEPQSLGGGELVAACHEKGLTIGNADAAFVRAVADGQPAWPTFRDAIRPHQLVDAIYRSAANGGAPQALVGG